MEVITLLIVIRWPLLRHARIAAVGQVTLEGQELINKLVSQSVICLHTKCHHSHETPARHHHQQQHNHSSDDAYYILSFVVAISGHVLNLRPEGLQQAISEHHTATL
ncbi:hypothetical protein E2C01_041292 [Portunus trituberculatus]|uniref:Secreted protein n=1 Tax=Portunus trituberculatus TaxID=210409 RepID=A0A5B7FT64_PORTR|nr:hypothetical protein [Portunus trituberculatus]